jgi:DNA-binding transcriptional MerR regulator
VADLPPKEFYKLSEVCQYTDTQPYVLRFWESEFPQLDPGQRGAGSRLYSRADVDLIRRIKQLLYEEEYTLADARDKLEEERKRPTARKAATATAEGGGHAQSASGAAHEPARASSDGSAILRPTVPAEPADRDLVSRDRYQDAIDEIDHLRLQVKDAENRCRRAEASATEARGSAERERESRERAAEILARILDRLS